MEGDTLFKIESKGDDVSVSVHGSIRDLAELFFTAMQQDKRIEILLTTAVEAHNSLNN